MKKAISIFLLALLCLNAAAHPVVNYALAGEGIANVALYYFKLGVMHIIPAGLDHILFIVSLCLLSTNVKTIVWQATAFTLAHTVTLALSMKSIIVAPSNIVEPIIALSIVFVAIENIILQELKPWRIIIVFLFGLIHGMGFASVLNEIGIPPDRFVSSVLFFNLGVEAGQLSIILTVFGCIIYPFGKSKEYRKYFVYPISTIIALVATWWTIERLM